MVGEVYTVTASEEDTLLDIARAHNVGYEEIRMANPDVSLWVPGEGTEVTIPGQFILPDEPRTGIVINVAELRMYYYPEAEDGHAPVSKPIPSALAAMPTIRRWVSPKPPCAWKIRHGTRLSRSAARPPSVVTRRLRSYRLDRITRWVNMPFCWIFPVI